MSALFKRAEQLKRWEESDTNRESPVRKNIKTVAFPIDCAFLASVSSGDKNEVNSLLYLAADINAANADGLTALHQVRSGRCNGVRLYPSVKGSTRTARHTDRLTVCHNVIMSPIKKDLPTCDCLLSQYS